MNSDYTTADKKKKKFSSHLVVRVFFTSLICLIVPLMLYCMNIMRVYYDLRIKDSYQAVSNVTGEKVHLFQQVLSFQFASMNAISMGIQHNILNHEEMQKVFKDFSDERFINAVLYLKPSGQGGGYHLETTSDGTYPKTDYSAFVSRYHLEESEKGLFIGLNSKGEKVLYLNLTLRNPNTKEITGFLIFDIHFHMLVKSIFDLSEWENLNVALIGANNQILATTALQYEGLNVMVKNGRSLHNDSTLLLVPQKIFFDTFSFELNNLDFLAAIRPIPQTPLKLMTFVPKNVLNAPMIVLLRDLVIGLVLLLLLGGGVLIFFLLKLQKPIIDIYKCMRSVSEGDLSARYVPRKMGFEVNSIGEMFNATVSRLSEIIEEIKSVRVSEEVLATELSLGQEVQHSLLPTQFETSSTLEIASRFVSARQVGGDCYDFLIFEDQGRDLFYVGDTSGKGIMACFYSLSLRSLLRAYGENIKELDKMVIEANNMFCRDTAVSGVFVTAWIGSYDEKSRTLNYTSAGHPPAILKRANGEIELLTTDGIALGAIELEKVEIKNIELAPGDMVILYTDGISEAQDSLGQYYGIERLKSCVRSISTQDPKEMANEIYDKVLEFYRGQEQFDDITLFVTKVK